MDDNKLKRMLTELLDVLDCVDAGAPTPRIFITHQQISKLAYDHGYFINLTRVEVGNQVLWQTDTSLNKPSLSESGKLVQEFLIEELIQ